MTNDELPFLDMKMSWSPKGDLKFVVFRKKGKQLKYTGKDITHTPSTLCAIPLELLNCLAKLTSRKPWIHSEGVETSTLTTRTLSARRGITLPSFPTMGYLWSKQDE